MSAPRYACSKSECTIAATGKCLELHAPSACPNATTTTAESSPGTTAKPSNKSPARTFPPATELGLKDALLVMQSGYAHVVAILGATDAGKTCMLNALYLLACHGELAPRFKFAGSLTLPGFELRMRRLRTWQNGKLPEQLAEHTAHADPRNPGLLHIALSDSQNDSRRVDLLLTDLPGEWTVRLIKQAQKAEQFEFLQRADALVIAIDSKKLWNPAQKNAELLNLENLVDRLDQAVKLDRHIPVFFVASKADTSSIEMPPGLDQIVSHAESKGFLAKSVVIASFSEKPAEVQNGYGIQPLIESIVDFEHPKAAPSLIQPEPSRSFGHSLGTEV